jgi:hypothetical protein
VKSGGGLLCQELWGRNLGFERRRYRRARTSVSAEWGQHSRLLHGIVTRAQLQRDFLCHVSAEVFMLMIGRGVEIMFARRAGTSYCQLFTGGFRLIVPDILLKANLNKVVRIHQKALHPHPALSQRERVLK